MYHPYFRGKQYELVTVRETASISATAGFVPVIEPVRQALSGLHKAVDVICQASGRAIVIVNPSYGDHSGAGDTITKLLSDHFVAEGGISAGILLKEGMSVADIAAICEAHSDHPRTLVHAGFSSPKTLVDAMGESLQNYHHVFLEPYCGKLYRRHFTAYNRTLIRDGFVSRKNREYPDVEPFSDLHVTYLDEGMNGFGDFLIAGDRYSDGGGPAYAVAIHITFIDPEKDDAMFIYHFKSIRQNTPTDPAGKFAEALDAMMVALDSGTSKILETEAVQEFRELHGRKHFPGLGYVKKLSMKHHVETLADFFS